MNYFSQIGEQQISKKTRLAKKAQKAITERDITFQLWRRHHRAELDAMLAGEHGDALRDLITFLQAMTLGDASELITRAEYWRGSDARFKVLTLIDTAIIRLRTAHGMVPFDDPLPQEPANVFLLVREVLS
jgi:hypothetical protein